MKKSTINKYGCTISSKAKINIFQILAHYCLKIINNSYLLLLLLLLLDISTDLSIEIQEDVQTRPIS